MSLRGRRALVTGASSGIGAACARALAAAGCRLVLVARRADRLAALAAALPRHAGARLLALDVGDRRAVEAAPADAFRADVLVNAAGLARGLEPLHEGRVDDWDEMIDTNLKGLLYVTRRVLPGMVSRGRGHVVHIGSTAGRWAYPGGNVYGATKAAVRLLTEGMRMDLLGAGVRVTTVDPGMVDTEFSTVRFHGDRARADAVYAGMRPLAAADVAEAVLWSLSRPAHVNVQEVVLMPTDQASVSLVKRRAAGGGAATRDTRRSGGRRAR